MAACTRVTRSQGRSLMIFSCSKNHSGHFHIVPGPVVDSRSGTDEFWHRWALLNQGLVKMRCAGVLKSSIHIFLWIRRPCKISKPKNNRAVMLRKSTVIWRRAWLYNQSRANIQNIRISKYIRIFTLYKRQLLYIPKVNISIRISNICRQIFEYPNIFEYSRILMATMFWLQCLRAVHAFSLDHFFQIWAFN
jgi:hypothetical protein